MRVPLSWLKEYVDIEEPVIKVDEILTNAGLEVKTIDYIGLPGSDLEWDRELVLLGHIQKVEQHPNADRLVMATVDYGSNEPEITVTGAPNLFQYLGMGDISHMNLYSPFAMEGATLYDGHKEGKKKAKLKERPLRGIPNRCMLCSEKELGISEEHDGIIIIPKDDNSPDYQAGTPLQDVLGDAVLEIDIIPNIARCASIVGVAREYAALTGREMRYPDYNVVMEGTDANARVQIRTENPELNPRFVAYIIEGINQNPSPYWMQHRLRLAGQRPINVAVDISNYVMLEMGQPNHAFDFDYLQNRAKQYGSDTVQIITRLPHEGETLTTLDDKVHKLPEHGILVTDPAGNLSLGGIMGGKNSEIKPETTNVLLEAAAWNFINIRRTATALGIHSDAGFRFSRGVHPSQALLGAKRAAELLRRLAGGTVAQGVIDTYPAPPETLTVRLNLDYARRLSGLDLSGDKIAELLARLEFGVTADGDDHLVVTVPDYRMDIEGPHDIVEEICRLYGYGNIPSTVLADTLPPQRGNPKLEKEERIKDILTKAGFQETITFRLTSPKHEAKLLVKTNPDDRPYVTVTNPISEDRAVMRHNLLASTLEIVADNSRYQERIAVFEVGPIFIVDEEEVLPKESTRLSMVMTGQREQAYWQGNATTMHDFFDLKGVLEQLFAELHLAVTYEATEHPTYRPGRTARMLLDGQQIGVMGELHPLVVEALDILVEKDQAVLAADLDLEAIIPHIPFHYPFDALSPFPAVHEDLALIVDKGVTAVDVAAAIQQAGGFLLKEVELFDVYEGDQIPAGKKSLAYHLTFLSPSKTLTDKDVRKQRTRIIKQVERNLGAQLRD